MRTIMQIDPIQVKIAFWTSDEIKFSEKANAGKLDIYNHKILLYDNEKVIELPYSEFLEYDLRKMNRIFTYIHLRTDTQILNFVVPRINIANWFLMVNYFKTKHIFEIIEKRVHLE